MIAFGMLIVALNSIKK
nr:putative holin-like toxin [Sedimentibacter sp.]